MQFFEMEFCVDGVPVYVTDPYDNMDAILDEVTSERNRILEFLAGHGCALSFDKEKSPDSPENEKAVDAFDYWLSDLALNGFMGCDIEDKASGITVACLRREVKQRYTPSTPTVTLAS